MTEVQVQPENILCRLCYNESASDLINIYSENGLLYDCERKISKYLYLQISKNDEFPNSICWNCLQNLETFHKFYEKINTIQKNVLKDRYDSVLLKAIYHNSTILLHHDSNSDYFSLTERQTSKTEENLFQENVKIENNDFAIDIPVYNEEMVNNVHQTQNDNNIILTDNDVCEIIPNENDEILLESVTNQLENTIENYVKIENDIVPIETVTLTNLIDEQKSGYMSTRSKTISSLKNSNKLLNVEVLSDIDDELKQNNDEESDDDFKIKCLNKKNLNRKIILSDDEKIVELIETKIKRKRGRPKGVRNNQIKLLDDISVKPLKTDCGRILSSTVNKKNKDLPLHDDIEEGESDNEFPARDSDNDDWPAQQTLNDFPDKILENGLLLVKGKKLMSMICKFYKLECEICLKDKPRFRQLRQLFNHYSENHKEEGYVTCCQTKLSRYPAIIMHLARHIQPDAFKCNVCGYMVTRPRFLESHKQTHLPEEQKPFGCDQCPRRFCWKGALQIHQISHQPISERKLYICHICGKIYDTPGGLSTHKKLVHTDRKQEAHVCHVCAKKFATRTGLNEHMATIHQPREKDQVQCIDCGKWLMNNRCLKSHMILHSTVIYDCRICEYTTKKPMLLRRHLLTQHSDEKPFSCQICGKSFKLKRALTVHFGQHSNTKSYKCTFCDRVFASSTNFYTHRKNMHPQELQEMKERELEVQRQKRIRAGIEIEEKQLLLESGMMDGDDEDENDDEIEDDDDNNILKPLCENEKNKIYTLSTIQTILQTNVNDNNETINLQTLTQSSTAATTNTTTILSDIQIMDSDVENTRGIVHSTTCSNNNNNNNTNESSIILNVEQLGEYL